MKFTILNLTIVWLIFICFLTSYAKATSCGVAPITGLLLQNNEIEVPKNFGGVPWYGAFQKITFLGRENDSEQYPKFSIINSFGDVLQSALIKDTTHTEYDKIVNYWIFNNNRIDEPLWAIRPKTGFEANNKYIYIISHGGYSDWLKINVDNEAITASVGVIPLKIGESLLAKIDSYDGGTGVQSVAQISVEMVFPNELNKYKEIFYFETLIDGRPTYFPPPRWCSHFTPGSNWHGKGKDVIYTACSKTYPGLSPGLHNIAMRAIMPGTDVHIDSETKTIRIKCPNELLE